MRSCGILLHISSLYSNYGIGTFGKAAYNFVDFLYYSNQKYWQVLPLGHTGFSNSPYQSFSTFAGNPYFIDLDILCDEGLLNKEYLNSFTWGGSSSQVDFTTLHKNRLKVWKVAYENFKNTNDKDYHYFCREEKFWLNDYAIYMSLSTETKTSWHNWDKKLMQRDVKTLNDYVSKHKDDIELWKFLQFEFFKQWYKLKHYANSKGIKIIGDLPIYVSDDSSDVWANPELFDLYKNLSVKNIAGVPPDAFSEDGQLWGNPVYKWENHKKENYNWWKKRFNSSFKMFDVIRIDHFRGFESYYSIPAGSTNAKNGKWKKGPGSDFFKYLGIVNTKKFNIIAEDLGIITPKVKKMKDECGFPGMKILQFAFNADLTSNNGEYLPHSIDENCIVYTGTHDNMTSLQWWLNEPKENKEFCMEYMGWEFDDDIPDKMISMAYMTKAELAIIPMQDWLCLGEEARMNTPSTASGNWKWRLCKNSLDKDLSERIQRKVRIYNR